MPTGLAVPEDKRFRNGLRVQFNHFLKEYRMCVRNIFDRLTFHGVGSEADEVDRMFRFKSLTDLAHRLESPNARPLAGRGSITTTGALVLSIAVPSGGTTRTRP